jgi:uncharacterized pyridoxal phosphate-containing UPF0001 family protein
VDRPSLVEALDRAEREVDVFIEVNLTNVPGRGGAEPEDITALAEQILGTERLRLRGLMAVAPIDEEPARAFDRVVGYHQNLLSLAPSASDLSLGMSGDFEEAISRGATHLRIGSAITGKRPGGP